MKNVKQTVSQRPVSRTKFNEAVSLKITMETRLEYN